MFVTRDMALVQRAHLLAQRLPIVIDERISHRLHVARDDLVELVEREPDAMIGDPVLRKVIRANALAAIATANERLTGIGPLLIFALAIEVVQPRLEHANRFGEILML